MQLHHIDIQLNLKGDTDMKAKQMILDRSLMLATLVAGSLLFAMVSATAHAGSYGEKKAQPDIVDTAISAGSFNTLVTALKAAELVETLKGDGPFTVFAPNDAAFAKIPQADLNALLQDRAALAKVLAYHVVPGKVMAADVVKLSSAKTVNGQSVKINAHSGVKVDNANVIQTDIVTRNGVIHVIDTVIMPN